MLRDKINFTKIKLHLVNTAKQVFSSPEEVLSSSVTQINASIPGNIELDMEKAGIVPELFFGTNILKLEEYELYDYWYECSFDANGDYDSICFEGIDTIAEIWLNGKKIGDCENMFIPHSFVINGVFEKNNALWIRIKSPVRYAEEKEYDTALWGLSYNAESVHVRKAPHSYGWDICPRAMAGGIFRDVYLCKQEKTEIEDVYIHTLCVDHNGAHARLSYDLKIDATLYHKTVIEVEGNCEESTFFAKERVVFKHGTFNFTIPSESLKLWNPVGYGEQYLYNVTATIKTYGGEILATKKLRFGVRTVELDYDKTGEEKKFLIKINGTPIMVKGTNWVPLDAFHSRDGERMGKALALLKEVGCNAVRCWGGNIYETEEFFDFCDENGILIWQDVMMACNVYPSTQEFYGKLEKELKSVLTRIRKHPALTCYCGDNECDLGMFFNGIDPSGYRVTREYLPALMFRFDPFRPFIPSSPYFVGRALTERDENQLAENHLWGPRNNFKSKFYLENKNVFISEIGYHGCPSVESIKKFIPKESLWHWENDDWMVHQTVPGGIWTSDWNRIKLMSYQVRELFGKEPETLEELSFRSQISQAEALKFFVEFTRLNKWNKTGILWWNLIDCWPQFSDAIVDYYYDKKLAFDYLKDVQAPLCFMIEDPVGWEAKCVIGNDGNKNYLNGKYEIFDGISGKPLKNGTFNSFANQNQTICDLPLSKNVTQYFILKLTVDGEQFYNHYINYGGALCEKEYKQFLSTYKKMRS